MLMLLAPFSEFQHWFIRSLLLARYAFFCFLIAVGLLAIDDLFVKYPGIARAVRKFLLMLKASSGKIFDMKEMQNEKLKSQK